MVTPGMVAHRYTLVREVGRGGMGAVWLAHDEVLGREVAVKQIGLFPGHQGLDMERAEREARLAARLWHPNVVAVYDLAVDGDAVWLVMEYVEGVTLSRLASDRGGLPADEAGEIIRQAAQALRVAHDSGIVHRDVKPSNLLVTPDGTTKLTDFGIARGVTDAALTQTGLLTGSPHYLAPEVAAGATATPASDLWSLGATLYQALTGRPPYELGENVVAGLSRIITSPPPRLADAGALGTVLEATMTHDPAQRWTAAQVCTFLDQQHLEPTRAMPLPPPPAAPPPAATSVLTAPSAPSGPPPVAPAPAPTPDGGRRPAPAWLWPATTAAVLLLVFALGAWLLSRSLPSSPETDPTVADDATSQPSAPVSTPTSSEPTPSPSPTAAASPTAEGMQQFVETYLATVTRDPRAAWEMLTPEFQDASDGLDSYLDFWRPIRGATISDVQADPRSLTISYAVTYDGPNNRPREDRTQLTLQFDDGQYRIAGEAG